jgi:hypothetical protein
MASRTSDPFVLHATANIKQAIFLRTKPIEAFGLVWPQLKTGGKKLDEVKESTPLPLQVLSIENAIVTHQHKPLPQAKPYTA